MIDEVLAQPHQLGDALWRVEAAGIAQRDLPGGLLACGMGGSAIGGDLAAAAIGSRAARPVRTVRGYAPEPWLTPDTLVLCASYSGHTEETLACFEAAGEASAERVVLTTGGPLAARAREEGVPVIGVPSGMQPRAAVVYMAVGALECAALCAAAPSLRDEIEGAAPVLEAVGTDGQSEKIAEVLRDTLPVVHGAEATAAPARRWKTQLNENAKVAAFASELPEANHNEIEGWRWAHDHAPMSAVFLTAEGHHPRVARRLELTAGLIEGQGLPVVRVAAPGESAVARVLSLVMLGDLVSVRLAQLGGIDPEPVIYIEGFKDALG
ncbi:MAG: bifunctional phosphoglucose/phosphomannose isomerase [Thermoleophilaceae bacterium]|nr:bifunctional phosphoglucose/phosphomannose isomerase [Thermoleophilaceae bacterium]